MQQDTLEQVSQFYQQLTASDPHAALMGCCDGEPVFLIECHQAQHDEVGKYYPARYGDYGMHLLIVPATRPRPQFSWQVFTVVMDFMFSRPRVQRVVVEPDVNNARVHPLNKRAGFQYQH